MAVPAVLTALTACGHSSDHAPTTTAKATPAPPVTTTAAAPPTHNTILPVPTTEPLAGAQDVDCGPLLASNGQTAQIIAVATSSGVVGCTEAVTIATRYATAQHTGDATLVDGWTCEPQPDTESPFVCFKDGFVIDLRGGGGPASPAVPPPPTTTVPPAPADVNCGPVTDAGGGSRTVIAVSTPAGVVGCTEAITVASDYATQIAPSDAFTVDGWDCHAQGPGSACAKDGLVINLLAH
ncbi:hypothetical protein EBN03_20140 [Nocardia stercoris]|uniref:Uncharacterized protein n=2 Tax=Nocardia stercoris TaxID=2483361 RepID=A0A3M2KZP6_9NOCA|nr:hypothetical protein EBN03_20140 [Nocardia stercoris]